MTKKVFVTAFYIAGEDNSSPYYVNVMRETEEEAMEHGKEVLMKAFPGRISSDFIPCGCQFLGNKEVES